MNSCVRRGYSEDVRDEVFDAVQLVDFLLEQLDDVQRDEVEALEVAHLRVVAVQVVEQQHLGFLVSGCYPVLVRPRPAGAVEVQLDDSGARRTDGDFFFVVREVLRLRERSRP